MKKFILPLVVCLTASLASCNKESTFVYNNYQDFATSYQGSLVADGGAILNVVENKTGTDAWKQEGGRFYILCDILNRQMEITLKELITVRLVNPLPLDQLDKEFTDPIVVEDCGISGGHFNLFYTYYYNPASNYAHSVHAWWDSTGSELNLYIYHDGNGENPSAMNPDLLKEKEDVISVPLADILNNGEFNRLSITLYELTSDKKDVKKNTYHLNGE